MRQILLIFSLFCASYMTVNAQTNTWTGAGANTNWNTVDNWSLGAVPTANNDVIIPTGNTVTINVSSFVKSIVVQGTSSITMNQNLSFTNASSFSGNTTVNWNNGSFYGGGTLTNNGTVILTTANNRYISGATTVKNNGVFTMPEGGTFNLFDTGVFNNTTTGIFDIQSDVTIGYNGDSHNFNNAGLLKKTGGTSSANFGAVLNNTGTISVESGILTMNALAKNFDGGIYNVSTDNQLVLAIQINVSNTLTGLLDGALTWAGNISVASTATFDFTGDTGVNWNIGSLIGGGVLTNASTINMTTSNNRYVSLDTTLKNTGLVTMPSGGTFNLFDTGVFNNTATGVFDIQSDVTIGYNGDSHNFNNAGLLKKTGGTSIADFGAVLTNTGTISVESGTLTMNGLAKDFDGGIYNVSSDNQLVLAIQINVSNILTGLLDGALTWAGNISVASTATFDFTGDTGVNWNVGSLIGGGILTNASTINLTSSNNRYVSFDSTLSNTGLIVMPSGGTLNLYGASTLDNQASGVFDIQSDVTIGNSGTGYRILNSGLIKKTGGTSVTYVYPPVTNSGIIDASSGTINFVNGYVFNNTIDGIVKGTATIDIPATATFTNDGTFAPGGSPGTLTVLGDFKSSPTSVLDVELNGLVQDTEYDLLKITGTNAIFEGIVNVTLGFEANIGDTFTIATVSGTIATKKLVSPLYADYGCEQYTFKITYPNDKAVVLTITGKKDVLPPEVITKNITVQLDATGKASITSAQIDNGSTDNCTSHENLVFTLSKNTFTCANLGTNTVNLTVVDEAGNSASAPATVTVVDVLAPIITCPVDQTVDVNAVDYVLPNYSVSGGLTASDNCSFTVVQTPIAGTNLAHGVHNIAFEVTDGSGNVAKCNFNLTVNDLSLGIEDHDLAEGVLLYPNPVRNILTIKNVGNLELLSADIVDITGKTINTINLQQMGVSKEISLENHTSGMYFLKIKGLNGSVTKRIIKQ